MKQTLVVRFGRELAGRWRWLAAAAIWLFAGVAACTAAWSAWGDPYVDATLARTGLRIHGPVTAIDKQPDGSTRVAYEFLNLPGKKFAGAVRMTDPQAVKALERSGGAAVVYLASDPRVNTLEGVRVATWSEERATALVAATAGALLPLAWAMLAAAFAAVRQSSETRSIGPT